MINSTKFDLRIYCLVASIDPLTIYVYRNGVARFCSKPYSPNSKFSCLTNTAVNRQNPAATIDSITKSVKSIFPILDSQGIDIQTLWKEIDNIIVMTVVSGIGFIHNASQIMRNPSRCFQILGFDILIGADHHPRLLEVNYRPSLEYDIEEERQMKIDMLSKAMKIVMESWIDQDLISNATTSAERENLSMFPPQRLFRRNPYEDYQLVFPSENPTERIRMNRIISEVKKLSTLIDQYQQMPIDISVSPIIERTDATRYNRSALFKTESNLTQSIVSHGITRRIESPVSPAKTRRRSRAGSSTRQSLSKSKVN